MRGSILLLALSLCSFAVSGDSDDELVARVRRLEQQLSSKALLEMLDKIERLQAEVQQLRGTVEEMQHSVDGMKQRQQGLYLDLDRRLLSLEGGEAVEPKADQPLSPGKVDSAPKPQADPADPSKAIELGNNKPKTSDANQESAYRQAFGLLNDGRYEEAIAGFNHVLENYPSGKYAGNAQYWLGESFYVTRDFDAARDSFEKVVNNYPDSVKVADAMLKLGYIHYELSEWKAASKALKIVIDQYPESIAARLATERLSLMKSERR